MPGAHVGGSWGHKRPKLGGSKMVIGPLGPTSARTENRSCSRGSRWLWRSSGGAPIGPEHSWALLLLFVVVLLLGATLTYCQTTNHVKSKGF